MTPLEQILPLVLGFAGAFVVVVAAGAADRDRPRGVRRTIAAGVGWAGSVVPAGWLLFRAEPAVVAHLGAEHVVHALAVGSGIAFLVVAGVAVYVSDQLAATAPTPRAQTPRAPAPPPAVRPPPRPEPVLAPPSGGTVATAGRAGSVESAEAQGLLASLRDGPDFQRPAAARALSLAFTGTAQPQICRALLDALADESLPVPARVESYLALIQVFGDELEWDNEVTVRRDFPEGVDPDRVLRWEDRLLDAEDAAKTEP